LKNKLISEKEYKKELEDFKWSMRGKDRNKIYIRGSKSIYRRRPNGSKEYILYPDGRVAEGYKRVIENGEEVLIQTEEE